MNKLIDAPTGYKESEKKLISHILNSFVDTWLSLRCTKKNELFDHILLEGGFGNSDLNWLIERLNNNDNTAYELTVDPLFIDDGVATYVFLQKEDFLYFLKSALKQKSNEMPEKKDMINEVIRKYRL